MGAKIIEKHVTIDRRMKGTDQMGSLGPDGVNRMIRDIRLFELSQGVEDIYIEPAVSAAKNKLERSIATKRFIKSGEMITENDLHLLSPGDGIKWADKEQVIGWIARVDIPENEIIYADFLKRDSRE
jgi:sialic acid synthase